MYSFSEFYLLLKRANMLAPNGRNYMQLGIAVCFPVEPRCRCCGLRTLLSAPKPQLTYSFCYQLAFIYL